MRRYSGDASTLSDTLMQQVFSLLFYSSFEVAFFVFFFFFLEWLRIDISYLGFFFCICESNLSFFRCYENKRIIIIILIIIIFYKAEAQLQKEIEEADRKKQEIAQFYRSQRESSDVPPRSEISSRVIFCFLLFLPPFSLHLFRPWKEIPVFLSRVFFSLFFLGGEGYWINMTLFPCITSSLLLLERGVSMLCYRSRIYNDEFGYIVLALLLLYYLL